MPGKAQKEVHLAGHIHEHTRPCRLEEMAVLVTITIPSSIKDEHESRTTVHPVSVEDTPLEHDEQAQLTTDTPLKDGEEANVQQSAKKLSFSFPRGLLSMHSRYFDAAFDKKHFKEGKERIA